MVRLTIDIDDESYRAAEQQAREQGTDVATVLLSHRVVPKEVTCVSADREPTPTAPMEWNNFFKWVDSLKLKKSDVALIRDDIYVR